MLGAIESTRAQAAVASVAVAVLVVACLERMEKGVERDAFFHLLPSLPPPPPLDIRRLLCCHDRSARIRSQRNKRIDIGDATAVEVATKMQILSCFRFLLPLEQQAGEEKGLALEEG